MNDFRDWLRLELAKRNLSQKELAGLLDVTQGIISRYLRGKDMPSAITLVKIAKAFNLPEKDVLAIGGYDENYRKISIAEADIKAEDQGEAVNPTDEKLKNLAKNFPQVFLDKFGELSENEKLDIIDVMELLIDQKRKREEQK